MFNDELVIEYNIAHEFPQQNSTVELKRHPMHPRASTFARLCKMRRPEDNKMAPVEAMAFAPNDGLENVIL
jgi:hypothetical protein